MSVRYENVEMAALAEPERRGVSRAQGLRGALLSAERTLRTEPVPVGGCAAVLSLHTVTRCAPWFAPGLVSGWWLSEESNLIEGPSEPRSPSGGPASHYLHPPQQARIRNGESGWNGDVAQ